MMLNMILPWFPIVLSAAIGARLVSGSRANWLGATCALFWVIVVQTATGVPFWADAVMGAGLLAGSAAILGLAHWSGRCGDIAQSAIMPAKLEPRPYTSGSTGDPPTAGSTHVIRLIAQFDDWLAANRFSADAWPAFDEFVRGILYTECNATHARTYRILSEGDYMVPLRDIESPANRDVVSARTGIEGHVATTGRSYYNWDDSQGSLVKQLAADSASASGGPAWCFAIRQGARTIGLVSVGEISIDPPPHTVFRSIELLVSQFWSNLIEVCRSHAAVTRDSTSGLLNRAAFLDEAHRSCKRSYSDGEPVALAVIAIEGLRTLLDEGRWDFANDVVYEVSKTLRQRVRPDDLLGRFDDSRFLLLLRRVDSALASLIANQLTQRLAQLSVLQALPGGRVGVRCGVAGSGTAAPAVEDLVARAVRLCHEARLREITIASDVGPSEPVEANA